ncbi:MAG: hypothetical protein NPIRA03_37780 [Nitrospirales bacterium]|nr:MAG: hypothetical protein NPIRA03_37780 [Nitrospirales bacterium]
MQLDLKGNGWVNAVPDIFEYIEAFYNRQGRHSALGVLTLPECEKGAIAA